MGGFVAGEVAVAIAVESSEVVGGAVELLAGDLVVTVAVEAANPVGAGRRAVGALVL